jgi:hypothetical protein
MLNALRKTFCVTAVALLAAACATPVDETRPLRFSAPEGAVLNEFYRRGAVAAHVVATPGRSPRIIVAFPAGNSGAAVWFDASSSPLLFQSDVAIEPAQSGTLRGVTVDLVATGGPIAVKQAILSNVRVIRSYQDSGAAPAEILVEPEVAAREVIWRRSRLDGKSGYQLSIQVLSGSVSRASPGRSVELVPPSDGQLRLRLTALTGEPPLTPIAEKDLLNATAAGDMRLRQILEFLSYEEKLAAGSWRFNTYFGRDTLMSLRLLAPVLQPRAVEAGLSSVLERLNAAGEVAHEEDIGEFAVLQRMRSGEPASDSPIFDYKMIDDDLMLPPVVAHYFLETSEGRARAAAFLERRGASGETYGARLVRNFQFVTTAAAPFARAPGWQRLIALKADENAGNWRDSADGLGGGRYPYDVNGVFAPAALDAIGRLHAAGVLKPYLDANTDALLAQATGMAEVWLREAPPLFDVVISLDAARTAVQEYARGVGVDPAPALAALTGDVRFRAVALDAQGQPIPILNSDEAFALLFLDPLPAEAERIANALASAFPTGLMTDAGLVVANPAYALGDLQPRFDRNRYHGTVIWSWQQAMFGAGLERQLARDDLPAPVRDSLVQARARLRAAIRAADEMRGSELWSWSVANGRYRLEPFGQREEDETESNAAQLWSTVHLALPR